MKKNIIKNVIIDSNLSAGGDIHIGDKYFFEQRHYQHIPPDNSTDLVPSQPESIAHFVGRDELLLAMKEGFASGARIQVLHGMLGMGKRRAVYEFIHRAKLDGLYKEFVWVIDFKSDKEIVDSKIIDWFDALELGYPTLQDTEKRRRLFNWLNAPNRDGILILINAFDYDLVKNFIPEGHFHILITTENPDLGKNMHSPILHKIDPLDQDSSIKLLSIRSGSKMDDRDMYNFAVNLEGYPFFLEQLGALFSANLLNLKDINQLMIAVAPKEGAELEERRRSFLNILFHIAEVNDQKPRLKGGIAEITYLFRVMAYAPIPNDFIIQYGAHLLEDMNWGKGVIGWLIAPFRQWALKRRKRATQQKIEYLNKLAKHSLIFVDEMGFITMHSLVHDFFKEQFAYRKNNFLERIILGENILEYTRTHLKMSKDKLEDTNYGRKILPHAISIADYYSEHFKEIEGLDSLYRKIGDFYEFEERLSYALTYFIKALDVQKRQKSPNISKSLVKKTFSIAAHTSRIKTYEDLKRQFPQEKYLEEYQILLCEGLKYYAEFDHLKAKTLLSMSLEKIPNDIDPDALRELQLLLKVINPELPSEENEAEFNSEEIAILKEESEYSMKYATFLILKSEARSRQAENVEEPEVLLKEALELITKGLSILTEIKKQDTSIYWVSKIGQLEYERRLGNEKNIRALLLELDTHKSDLENHLGEQSQLFAAIILAKAHIAKTDNDTSVYISTLIEGVRLLEHNFPDLPNHPTRRVFEDLLEEENALQNNKN